MCDVKNIIKLSIALLCILGQASFAQTYITYPLNDGDYWQYEVLDYNEYYSYQIIGDTSLPSNGLTYKVLQGGGGYKIYRRFFEDKVYYYNNYIQRDQILYDFTLQPGDTVAVFPNENDTLIITLVNIWYDNVFGMERKQWSFLFDVVPYIDDEIWYTIADGIGETSSGSYWENHELVGAIINGITYGNIVSAEDERLIPTEIALEQNYPNPFNPTTKIKYSIPQSSNVVIKVYDVLGNEIETLVNEQMSVGTYEITWYAGQLPSGVYFYQLQTNGFLETKKMILLK